MASADERCFSISSCFTMFRNKAPDERRTPPIFDHDLTCLFRLYLSPLDILVILSFLFIPFVHFSNSFSQFDKVLTGTTNKTLWILPRFVFGSTSDGCSIIACRSDRQARDFPRPIE